MTTKNTASTNPTPAVSTIPFNTSRHIEIIKSGCVTASTLESAQAALALLQANKPPAS